jgi:Methylase of polypeptide chain release factors
MTTRQSTAGWQILAGRDKCAPECRLLADLMAFGGMAAGTIVASELRECCRIGRPDDDVFPAAFRRLSTPVPSLIYSHIQLYRSAMNVLYFGGYRRRFDNVIALLGAHETSVCDLCFGDTIIADWCAANRTMWTGVDLNPSFCARARKRGHHVIEGDLLSVALPSADVYVMAGSLYHFHDRLPAVFDRVWQRTGRWILSEPVRNLSSDDGVLGRLAKRSANPGDGHAAFRYTERTLLDALREQQQRHDLTCRVVSIDRDMLVVMERGGAARGVR